MKSNKPKRGGNNDFQNQRKIMNLIFSLRNHNNTIGEQEHGNHKKNKSTEIIKEGHKSYWAEKWTARGTVALAIITGFLAWYTYKLFDEASTSSKLAAQTHKNDSVLDERRFENDTAALGAQIRNAQEMYRLNKDAFDSSNANNRRTFAQQIASLNEAKTEFKKVNQSFLEVHPNIDMDVFKKQHIVTIDNDFSLVGNQPVRIDSLAMSRRYFPATYFTDMFDSGNIAKKFDALNIPFDKGIGYITKDVPANLSHQSFVGLSKNVFDGIIKRRYYLFMVGRVNYTNLVTGDRYVYKYIAKVFISSDTNNYTYSFKYNENLPIK